MVRNGYCPTCVGCQKNCFDFNQRAAIFGDLADNDPRHSTQRMIFMSLLPGLIWGYYNVAGALEQGFAHYLLSLVGCALFGTGLFFTLRGLLNFTAYRLATGFGLLALLIYYYYAGPVLVNTVSGLAGVTPPGWLVDAIRFLAVPIAAAVLLSAMRAERAYQELDVAGSQARVDAGKVSAAGAHDAAGIQITERNSGKQFSAKRDQTLLEAMEAAGIPIDYGCRSGLCGADPVGIVDGHDHLDAPGAEEQATLSRLGLEGRARLACCCRATGAVTIDRDAQRAVSGAGATGGTEARSRRSSGDRPGVDHRQRCGRHHRGRVAATGKPVGGDHDSRRGTASFLQPDVDRAGHLHQDVDGRHVPRA